jgi:sec-independent protein translocase protein TatA
MHSFFAWLPHGADFIWLFLLAVLLFGADKLPKLARGFGKSLGEFKKAKEEFEKEIHSATSADETKTLAENKGPTVITAPTATPRTINPVAPTPTEDELTKKI